MKLFTSLFEIMICMNILLLVSTLFIKKIVFRQKPSIQLYLARLLFMSCILSPIAIHFINLPQYSILGDNVTSSVINQSSINAFKNKISENIDELTISKSLNPQIDFEYVYLVLCILYFSGFIYRIMKFNEDIHKTKTIITLAEPYKASGNIAIKVTDDCVVPFSIRLMNTAYIILPISILRSSNNTKLAIAHEGQHHRQGDCLFAYLIEFTRIIFWFNPCITYWRDQFEELQELACDEALISKNNVSAHDYGTCLFDVSKTVSTSVHHYQGNLVCTAKMIPANKIQTSLITRRICMLSEYQNERLSKTLLGSILALSAVVVIGPLCTAYAAKGVIPQNANSNAINMSSIEPSIQTIAAKEISRAVTQSHAKSGAIVIADAHTGKIVAFAEAGTTKEKNSWRSRVFTPASTIKPFIVAAAIDAGVTSPSKTYDCHSPYQIDGKEFINNEPNVGNLSLSDAVTISNNVCMIKVAQETGAVKTRETLSRFGFDTRSGWDKNDSDALNLANITIGSSTPVTLQTLTNAYTILANKGHLSDSNSETAVSEETANTVTQLLENVVTNGTGKRAAMTQASVAGKTGTLSNDTHTSTLALFAGYVPATSPRYVSIVVIENAKVNGSMLNANGGNVAAPVFRNALERTLAVSK